jgi:hypothetical protein
LVEHATENRSVGGSIPPLGTIPSTHKVCGSIPELTPHEVLPKWLQTAWVVPSAMRALDSLAGTHVR